MDEVEQVRTALNRAVVYSEDISVGQIRALLAAYDAQVREIERLKGDKDKAINPGFYR